jgi:glycine/D-amino acid oxidase-like deaminating enzyme
MRLHSGAPFWLVKNGLEEMCTAPPGGPVDVVILGAGITGALVADALTAEGLSVAVLDRRAPACGSTAASTALVTYELDAELHQLIEIAGEQAAVRAYRLNAAAVDDLAGIADSLDEPCGFARRPSLYLATRRRHRDRLEREVELRSRFGLDAEFWPPERVEATYGFASHGALRTTQAGVLDPVRYTRALLRRAISRGATLLARTPARSVTVHGERVTIGTDRGSLEARWLVYATGYETPEALRPDPVALHSTYAVATEPLADFGPWQDQCLIWETGRPYHYLCATEDRRILIGGADTRFRDAAWRDRLMPGRTRRLEARLGELFPTLPIQMAFAWAGTFGLSPDSLPYIGPDRSCPRSLFALGYGANGITFGAVAAQILRDLCMGRENADAELFRLDRRH